MIHARGGERGLLLAPLIMQVVIQHAQLQGEDPLGGCGEYLPQFGVLHPPYITHFLGVRHGFGVFHLTNKHQANPW
jgi:hypothetical protein